MSSIELRKRQDAISVEAKRKCAKIALKIVRQLKSTVPQIIELPGDLKNGFVYNGKFYGVSDELTNDAVSIIEDSIIDSIVS